jgi:hypothetical protein
MPGAIARRTKWGLPWLSMIAISAMLAYLVTLGSAGPPSFSNRGEKETAELAGPVSLQGCDSTSARLLLYAISNGWLAYRFGSHCS